ncbi:hypothetical protein J7E73_06115 [Paenibacillus albidus]|uniref:hypothetical protein n=1 Tax=Paenibacillus albidus TaxID=2041023 RepID=UPI001BEAE5FF|nr:hypothetical protein [Paenibacillus albidus]MBT2288716.1 hypothetical protein [Paenibacillus albidus]
MIEAALSRGIKVILLTPAWDRSYGTGDTAWLSLVQHTLQINTLQIRRLAQEYEVGLSDSLQCFSGYNELYSIERSRHEDPQRRVQPDSGKDQ